VVTLYRRGFNSNWTTLPTIIARYQSTGSPSCTPLWAAMIVVNAPRGDTVDLSFTVHRDDYARALALTGKATAQFAGSTVEGDDRVAKLAVVGSGMRSHAGVAATLFGTLGREGINVRLVSTSEIKISVLVDEGELERAVRALHAAFGLAGVPGS